MIARFETLRDRAAACRQFCELRCNAEDVLALFAVVDAATELLMDDDMPNHWPDCACSYCTKNRALRAALARLSPIEEVSEPGGEDVRSRLELPSRQEPFQRAPASSGSLTSSDDPCEFCGDGPCPNGCGAADEEQA